MSNSAANLSRKIGSAGDLQGVVRTMKAHAASSISQYEKSVSALDDYYRVIKLGLGASFRASEPSILAQNTETQGVPPHTTPHEGEAVGVIVFGSDQGLVGQFNQDVASFVVETLATLPGKPKIWAVGERVYARLADAGLSMAKNFIVPTNVNAIAPLVGQLQLEIETARQSVSVYVFHNHSINSQTTNTHKSKSHAKSGVLYEPVVQRLLPLDRQWQQRLAKIPWPTSRSPEILCGNTATIGALIREYFFISLYRACAQSLACENASRLAAMLRAEKNIDELLENLAQAFHRLRQSSIDEELFDVVAGYELLDSRF